MVRDKPKDSVAGEKKIFSFEIFFLSFHNVYVELITLTNTFLQLR